MYFPLTDPIVVNLRPYSCSDTLFLDRDGILNDVIIRGSEISSPRNIEELSISDDIDALSSDVISKRWNLVVVTNQPDLSRELIDVRLLDLFHEAIVGRVNLNAIYICPHLREDKCGCRKPAPGLVERFRYDNPDINGREIYVGDRESDLLCAERAGVPFILRRREYNGGIERNSRYVVDNLYGVKAILAGEEI